MSRRAFLEAALTAAAIVSSWGCGADADLGQAELAVSHVAPVAPPGSAACTESVCQAGSGATGGVVVLDPTASASFGASGATRVAVEGMDLVIASSSSRAGMTDGAASVRVTGGVVRVVGGLSGSFAGTVVHGPVADPLAGYPAPPIAGLASGGSYVANGTTHYRPGLYQGISIASASSVVLDPGLYVLRGGGLSISGAAKVSGAGVMFFNTTAVYPAGGATACGAISLSGSASATLSAPTVSLYGDGTTGGRGMLLFQDPACDRRVSLTGASSSMFTGTVYAPSAHLDISGAANAYSLQVIVETLTATGSSNLTFRPHGDAIATVCTERPKADGTTCDDGDACTIHDACHAGTCGGDAAPSCAGSPDAGVDAVVTPPTPDAMMAPDANVDANGVAPMPDANVDANVVAPTPDAITAPDANVDAGVDASPPSQCLEPDRVGATVALTRADGTPVDLGAPTTTLSVETRGADGTWRPAGAVVVDHASRPMHDVVIVADNSGSQLSQLPQEQAAIDAFVTAMAAHQSADRIGLVRVSTQASEILGLTNDRSLLTAAVGALFVSNGWTALWDGVRVANSVLASAPPVTRPGALCYTGAQRSVLLFTDGRDNNSSNQHPTRYADDGVDTSLSDLLALEAQGMKTAVHAVGIGAHVDEAALKTLAAATGGSYRHVDQLGDLVAAFDGAAADLDRQVPVCFQPTCGGTEARITVSWIEDGQTMSAQTVVALH